MGWGDGRWATMALLLARSGWSRRRRRCGEVMAAALHPSRARARRWRTPPTPVALLVLGACATGGVPPSAEPAAPAASTVSPAAVSDVDRAAATSHQGPAAAPAAASSAPGGSVPPLPPRWSATCTLRTCATQVEEGFRFTGPHQVRCATAVVTEGRLANLHLQGSCKTGPDNALYGGSAALPPEGAPLGAAPLDATVSGECYVYTADGEQPGGPVTFPVRVRSPRPGALELLHGDLVEPLECELTDDAG